MGDIVKVIERYLSEETTPKKMVFDGNHAQFLTKGKVKSSGRGLWDFPKGEWAVELYVSQYADGVFIRTFDSKKKLVNVDNYGLPYTDGLFLKGVNELFTKHGKGKLFWSEQGMQGEDYAHVEGDKPFEAWAESKYGRDE